MQHRRVLTAVLAGVLALSLTACGGDDDQPSAAPETGPGSLTTVPDVDGLELTEAAQTLADEGLRAAVEYLPSDRREGTTFGQAPPAGTELQRGESVRVSVARGRGEQELVRVPNALDQTAADAQATLEQARFEVLVIPVPAVAEDTVIAHSPAAGAEAPRGALVVVYAGG